MARQKQDEDNTHSVDRDPDETAALIDELEAERDRLRAERDDFDTRWKRALADLENYRRRAAQSEQDALRRGRSEALQTVVKALDHLDSALAQNSAGASAESVLAGVQAVHGEMVRALESQGVRQIRPEVGDEFDPVRHEALMRQPAEGVAPGNVSMVIQSGYSLNDWVMRPAKVAVAPEAPPEDHAGGGEG